jgi:hypothetical protein
MTILLVCIFAIAQAQITLKNTELAPAVGSWQGSLTYLDYTSKKLVEIPATLGIEQIKVGVFTFTMPFPIA